MFNFTYKENIQFLRALSVLLVFLYHLNFEIFNKGYLGVDIFFVISGFVITQSIFLNIEKNNGFNIIYFFKKRILRIIPNLIFILSVVFLFYQFFGPNNLSLWNDFVTSILGFSNLYFLFADKGYFYNIFDNPFAHTWSLGVEEQFYFLYPFVIFFLFRNVNNFKKNIKIFLILLCLIILSSLLFSIYYSLNNSDLSFYFSPLRFWELGWGCFLFLIEKKIPKNQSIRNLSFLLLILVIFSDFNIAYIINNILVILFAGLFIVTSRKKFILTNYSTLLFGKISYSFYLWHLPIIFFINFYFESFLIQTLISFLVSFILSLLTYQFIEKPFMEFNQAIKKLTLFVFSFFVFSLTFLLIIKITDNQIRYEFRKFIDKNNYLEKKYNWREKVTFQSIFIKDKEIHKNCDDINTLNSELKLNENCLKKSNNKYLVFIEGDSHTAQFVNPINSADNIENLYFRFSPQKYVSSNLVKKISKEYENIFYLRDINNSENLEYIINSDLQKINNIKFIFFNSTPFIDDKIQVQRCVSRQIDCIFNKDIDIQKRELVKLNDELNNIKLSNKKVYLFDSYNSICPKNSCKIYDKNEDILYYMDNTHLSNQGSQMLQKDIEQFFQNQLNINYLNK